MLFPIRCITCGKVINHYHKVYLNLIDDGKTVKEALDTLNITRYCCRRMFICHNDNLFDYISQYDKADFPFIQNKFEKNNPTTSIQDEQINQFNQEMKNSDSENSDNDNDNEILDENFDFDNEPTIDDDFDD